MAGANIFQGQIFGPFKANQELMDLIAKQCTSAPKYIKHLGIQTETHNVLIHPNTLIEMIIGGQKQSIEIGKTGIYEIGNTNITSIKFLNDRDNNTIIDFTVGFDEPQKDDSSM